MASAYIGQADLESRFGVKQVLRVFCDDGSNTVGPRLAISCDVGSREADSILATAWPSTEQRLTLVTSDLAIWASVCDLAMADGMSARPEWQVTDGSKPSPYQSLADRAKARLKQLAQAQIRSVAEETAGKNPHTRMGKVSRHEFIFAPSNGRAYRGGF